MGQIPALTVISNGNTSDATQVMNNENSIRTVYNLHDTAITGVHGIVAPDTLAGTAAQKAITDVMKLQDVPIGSIIPFYDYNGALTFNTTYWAYCNGQTVAVGSLGAQTLPDLSNRYLVGFGTEGGADIGSAAWSTAAVGNASHQTSIAHNHIWLKANGFGIAQTYKTNGTTEFDVQEQALGGGASKAVRSFSLTESQYTNLGGSTTQNIQPRSISVRFIMRIA